MVSPGSAPAVVSPGSAAAVVGPGSAAAAVSPGSAAVAVGPGSGIAARLLDLRIRYKPPQGDSSREFVHVVTQPVELRSVPSRDSRLAAAAAAFALLLRQDDQVGQLSWARLEAMVDQLGGERQSDAPVDRDAAELCRLVALAAALIRADGTAK